MIPTFFLLLVLISSCTLYPLQVVLIDPLKEVNGYLKDKANQCRHSKNNIIDIYYAPNRDDLYVQTISNFQKCPYTLNKCDWECPTLYIARRDYDDWAKEFTDLGLKPPHPKKRGWDNAVFAN